MSFKNRMWGFYLQQENMELQLSFLQADCCLSKVKNIYETINLLPACHLTYCFTLSID